MSDSSFGENGQESLLNWILDSSSGQGSLLFPNFEFFKNFSNEIYYLIWHLEILGEGQLGYSNFFLYFEILGQGALKNTLYDSMNWWFYVFFRLT